MWGLALGWLVLLPRVYVQPAGLVPHGNPKKPRENQVELPKVVPASNAQVPEEVKSFLQVRGFTKASIDRLQKCVLLCRRTVEARLQSTSLSLLNLNQTKSKVAETIETSSPGDDIERSLKQTVQWLLDVGLSNRQVVKVIVSSPGVLGNSGKALKSETLQLLVDLGLSKGQSAKAIARCPDILDCKSRLDATLHWLLSVGLTGSQVAKLITASPQILGLSIEEDLKPKVQWLLALLMTKNQVAKAIATFPKLFVYNTERNLKPRAQWFLDLGMSKKQVGKVVAACPQVLGYSIEQNLKPKVDWLMALGLSRDQVVKSIVFCTTILRCSTARTLKPKVQWLSELGLSDNQLCQVISSFPSILKYSISRNLTPKKLLLQQVFGTATAEVVLQQPRILGSSYQTLNERLKVLVERKETFQLIRAMQMTQEGFNSRYFSKRSKTPRQKHFACTLQDPTKDSGSRKVCLFFKIFQVFDVLMCRFKWSLFVLGPSDDRMTVYLSA